MYILWPNQFCISFVHAAICKSIADGIIVFSPAFPPKHDKHYCKL